MQFQMESKLNSVKIGGNKSNKQLSEIENITNFYKLRQEVIKFHNNYFMMLDKAEYGLKHGKCRKILTLKQLLQRLQIPLAQANAGNTSENVLNEIRRIIYSLYWEKEVNKKVNNKIMNSKKL